MKVFGIGLSRTGTTSLTEALTILGYSAIHHTRVCDLYNDADAATDAPIAVRYKELDILFPHSKFILTTRDLDSWLISYKEHDRKLVIESLQAHDRFEYSWLRVKMYGQIHFDETLFTQGYKKHHNEVTSYFTNRSQDILVLNICGGEGWPKLCEFLGKPIPSAPFPHLHKNMDRPILYKS